MHDINERNLIPLINILNLFSRTSKSHHYSTRSSTSQHMYIKNLDLICKRMRSLVLAQRYGMKGQIALKTYQGSTSEKNLEEAFLHIVKTKENYIDNVKGMAKLKNY